MTLLSIKYFTLIILLLFQPLWLFGYPLLHISDSGTSVLITKSLEVASSIDPRATDISFAKTLNYHSWDTSKEIINRGYSDSTYWFRTRICFEKQNQNEGLWFLQIEYPVIDNIAVCFSNQKEDYCEYAGEQYPYNQRSYSLLDYAFKLPEGDTIDVYFMLQTSMPLNTPVRLIRNDQLINTVQTTNWLLGLYYGAMCLLLIANLIFFMLVGERSFAYLALHVLNYIAVMAVFDGIAYKYIWPDAIWWNNQSPSVLMALGVIPGLLFSKTFFGLSKNMPIANKLLNGLILLSLAISLFNLFSNNYGLNDMLATLTDLLVLIFMLWVGIKLWRRGVVYAKFFFIGWICVLLGIGLFAARDAGLVEHTFLSSYGTYFGSILEVLFLSISLAEKVSLIQKENQKNQQLYIRQLEENRELKDKINQELEQKVKERTDEIILQQRELESQKREIERKRSIEYSLEALRAHMNPHFVFNALNSIQRFILKKDSKSSNKYLTQFSKLIRMIFEHSQHSYINLKKEIESLKLYLDLESLRFDGHFKYEIQQQDIDHSEEIFIPTMLIQPIIENAIWHGIMHKDGSGNVSIQFCEVNGMLQCIVEDDGVGRAKSAEVNAARTRKSAGLGLLQKRIDLLNSLGKQTITFQIEDLYHNIGDAAGTRVTIQFNSKFIPDDQGVYS